MCFPDLYPEGRDGQHETRLRKIKDSEFIKQRLMNKHPQFRLNIQYLFFLLHDSNIRQINAGIFHKLNVPNPQLQYTAGNYLNMLQNQELERNLNTIHSRLRNTAAYWTIPRNNLRCMVNEYGPATWFVTLSPAEWRWGDLHDYIRKVNAPHLDKMAAGQLIAADPVSTSRFMNNKFHALMEFLCSDEAPLSKMEHYFWRLEYQTRGGHHWHCLMWAKKAPVIGKCTNEEVAEFIMQYVTCAIPDKKISPLLHERVNAHQRHSHNAYCLRCKQTNEKCYKVCRFGFPRNVTDNFVLRAVETSIAGRALLQSKKRLYDVPRVIGEEYINDYNPTILYTWEGNMDIQFVGEVSTAIIEYVLKYATKPEKSNIDLGALLSTDSSKSLIQRLWAIGTKTLCHRECGALEAADTLLGYPLHGTDPDTSVRWIDINEIRPKKLKQKNEIEKLDKESTDLFFPNLTDDYYPQRPDELADYCLYDFAKWFDIVYTKPQAAEVEFYEIGKNRYLRKRSRGHPINHYKYKENRDEEKFFFSLLILFQPWRSIEELKNQCKTYAKSFDKVKSTLTKAMEYHQKITELQEAFEAMDKVVQKKIVEDEIEADKKNNDAASSECIPIEAQAAMNNFKDLNENINDVDVDELIAQMNPDQKRVFDKVIQSLQSGTDVLRMYVSGEGGTDKSFLLHAIRCWVKQKMGKDVAVAAPTGIAAFSIQGLTIHKLFQLPVEHGQTPEYRPLTDDALKTLRENLRNVALFVIDEVSMISNITMMYIHLRLAEIFDTSDKENGYFGGVPILFLGDIMQLQPVRANPPYMAITKEEIQKYVKCCGNINLWKELFTYEELTINMRQKGDTAYKELLSRVRIGLLTDDDIKTLSERRVNFRSDTIEGRLGELCNFVSILPPATVCILPTKHMCAVLNHKMLSLIESEEINLYAIDKTDCTKNKEKKVLNVLKKHEEDYSRSGGLPSVITIKVGCKVMILRNIDVAKGLVNGTIATVTFVSRSIYGDGNVDSIKVTVDGIEEHIIERVNVKFEILTKAYVTRHQFPIGLSYAITVHKSQGLSKKSVVVDAGNSMFADGQVYVALSRVTTLEGLHLINFDPHAVKANPQAILEYNRLRTKYRLDLPSLHVADGRADKRVDSRWIANKKLSEIQDKVAENAEIVNLHYIRGLPNKDNASCYANSTLQCLFNCEKLNRQIRTLPRNNSLHAALRNYTDSRKDVDVKAVRGFVNQLYEASRQQDVTAFITALLKRVESLQPIVQCSARFITSCTNPPCVHSETVINAPMFIIVLPVAIAQKKSVDLQSLLDERYSKLKTLDEDECAKCKHFGKTEKSEIYISSSVVIIQLEIFQEKDGIQTKMGKCLIKGIPTSRIKIDTKTYKVTSAIFHKESKSGGHYTVMIRQKKNKWLEIDNSTIAAKSWPNNAKCAYIFFLEKIENNRLCTKYRKDLPSVQVPVDIRRKSVASTQIFSEEVPQIQTNVTENTQIVDLHRCRGLPNLDHVSCYANSTLQCFFHSEQLNRQIRTLPQNNTLHVQLRNYIDRSKTVDVYAVRSYVDKIYEAIQQQDVHEFITSLLQKVESLQPIVQYSYNTVLKCVQCNETSVILEPSMFLVSLPVRLAQEKSVTLQQLLDEEYGEKEELRDEVRCDTCEHTRKTAKLEIFSSSSIVIIQLQLFQNEGAIVRKIDNCVIKEIPSSQIKFGTNQYRVMSAIFHAGIMEAGHYTVMIRQKNNQWLQIDDSTIKDKSWPNEANPPYILFLEKI